LSSSCLTKNLFNIPQILTSLNVTCYSFLLAQATIDHVPHFSPALSLSIVDPSGASPQDVPGCYLQNVSR